MVHFPLSPGRPKKAATTGHVRSVNVPYHSDPLLAHLEDVIHALRSWLMSSSDSLADMLAGLAHIDAVIAVLGELLELPQAVKALHDVTAADRLLDGFLLLADAYGSFESALITLKQHLAELHAAIRRGDGARFSASLRSQRRTEKELSHLAATMRYASKCTSPSRPPADAEVVGIVAEAAAATAAASEAIFSGCASLSPAMSSMAATVSSKKWLARLGVVSAAKKTAPETAMVALERLGVLEECIGELENGSEKVFRSLVQTRVSLLNIHTPL